MRRTARTSSAIRSRIPSKGRGYARLVTAIATASRDMVGRAAAAVNQALVIRNWLVGAHIVEYEQAGSDRAKYGARLLERLAGGCREEASRA